MQPTTNAAFYVFESNRLAVKLFHVIMQPTTNAAFYVFESNRLAVKLFHVICGGKLVH